MDNLKKSEKMYQRFSPLGERQLLDSKAVQDGRRKLVEYLNI